MHASSVDLARLDGGLKRSLCQLDTPNSDKWGRVAGIWSTRAKNIAKLLDEETDLLGLVGPQTLWRYS